MRKLLVALAAVLAVAGCSTGADQVDVNNGGEFRFVAGTPAGEVIAEGERASAPQFSGTLLDGGDWDSADCRVETPQFQEVYDDVADQGVQFLGLNVKDQQQLAEAFVDNQGITFPSLFDPAGEVALAFRDYPASAIPSTIVLDRYGRVAAVYTGEVSQDDLRTTLDALVAEG
ncbi:TlpA disulfide reductase family protein [Klenkia terrae]